MMVEYPILCNQCMIPMDRIVERNGVVDIYSYNKERNQYEQVDADDYGEVTTTYRCPDYHLEYHEDADQDGNEVK